MESESKPSSEDVEDQDKSQQHQQEPQSQENDMKKEVPPRLCEHSDSLNSPEFEDVPLPGETESKRKSSFPVLGASPTIAGPLKMFLYPVEVVDTQTELSCTVSTAALSVPPTSSISVSAKEDDQSVNGCATLTTNALASGVPALEDTEACKNSENCWGQLIPQEILLKIIRDAVQSSGPVPLLCR